MPEPADENFPFYWSPLHLPQRASASPQRLPSLKLWVNDQRRFFSFDSSIDGPGCNQSCVLAIVAMKEQMANKLTQPKRNLTPLQR
jgi:hypothetical protein